VVVEVVVVVVAVVVEVVLGILADMVLFCSLDGTHVFLPQHLMIFALLLDLGKFATLLTAHIRIRINLSITLLA
jgi:hypothetical protein